MLAIKPIISQADICNQAKWQLSELINDKLPEFDENMLNNFGCIHLNHPIIQGEYRDEILQIYPTLSVDSVTNTKKMDEFFNNMSDADVLKLGYNPYTSHPKSMIWNVMPLPPAKFIMNHKDLYSKVRDIVRTNWMLLNCLNNPKISEEIRSNWIELLQYHVNSYLDNSEEMVDPSVNREGKPLCLLRQLTKFDSELAKMTYNIGLKQYKLFYIGV